jgi:nitric oxide synthase-interacting protein
LKRLKKEAEQRKIEDGEEKDIEDAEKQARDVEEFERVQAGLSARSNGAAGTKERIAGRKDVKVTTEQETDGKGIKRKLELDEAELAASRKKPSTSSLQDDLPSFWVPGKIPKAQKVELKTPKAHPTCPAAAADKPHDISLKTLISVHFTGDSSNTKDVPASASGDTSASPTRTCPSCNKTLSNATKAILAKPCGHVLCKPCSEKFQRAAEKSAHDSVHDETVRCYVCQEDVTAGRKGKKSEGDGGKKEKIDRGLVELSSEGTGFAGGGANMVKRHGVAFQC